MNANAKVYQIELRTITELQKEKCTRKKNCSLTWPEQSIINNIKWKRRAKCGCTPIVRSAVCALIPLIHIRSWMKLEWNEWRSRKATTAKTKPNNNKKNYMKNINSNSNSKWKPSHCFQQTYDIIFALVFMRMCSYVPIFILISDLLFPLNLYRLFNKFNYYVTIACERNGLSNDIHVLLLLLLWVWVSVSCGRIYRNPVGTYRHTDISVRMQH